MKNLKTKCGKIIECDDGLPSDNIYYVPCILEKGHDGRCLPEKGHLPNVVVITRSVGINIGNRQPGDIMCGGQ